MENVKKQLLAKKMENVQMLRLLAAVGIILYHSGIVDYFGYFGVEIFNIISGFIMMYSTQNVENFYPRKFVAKKICRLVPLYWLWTIFMDILLWAFPWISTTTKHGVSYLIKSLLFIPFSNDLGYSLPIVGVGWTLTYEMAFIVVFTISMTISKKYRGVIASIVLFVLWGGNLIWNAILPNVINDYYSNSLILEFIYGILLFFLFARGKVFERTTKRFFWYGFFALLGYFVLIILSFGYEMGKERGIILGSVAVLFVAAFLKFTQGMQFPKKLVSLGDMTYSIYLAEHFTTGIYRSLTQNVHIGIKVVALIPLFAITFLISKISYDWIEKSFYKFLCKGKL